MSVFNTKVCIPYTRKIDIRDLRNIYFNYLLAKSTGGKTHLIIDDSEVVKLDINNCQYNLDKLSRYSLEFDSVIRRSELHPRYLEVAEQFVLVGFADKILNTFLIKRRNIQKFIYSFEPDIVSKYFADAVELHDLNVDRVFLTELDFTGLFIETLYSMIYEVSSVYKSLKVMPLYPMGKYSRKYKKINRLDLDYYDNFHPEAVLNWCVTQGWTPPKSIEHSRGYSILRRVDTIKCFSNGTFSRAVYPKPIDYKRLTWFDKKHKVYEEIINNRSWAAR